MIYYYKNEHIAKILKYHVGIFQHFNSITPFFISNAE